MSTTIRTTSEKQFNQISRFTKNSSHYCITNKENGLYTITLFGLTITESEKFIKNLIKTNHFTKVQHEPLALAA